MKHRLRQYREIGRATFPRHQRGVDVLGVLSILMILGVTCTGVWQYFAHEPNPNWFEYVPNTGYSVAQEPPRGVAQAHGLFGDGAGIVALAGGGWFAYRIAHRVPAASIVALICILFAALTESLVRFNIIKMDGQDLDEVGPGYHQIFTGSVDYVVTDVGQSDPNSFRLMVAAHIATVPILVGFALWSILRGLDRRSLELENAPERTWFRSLGS